MYQDPSEVKMENGRTMADYMRRGPAGLRGTVVGKATAGGTPVNYDPHDMSKVKINIIDPDGKGTTDIAISEFTSDRLNAALAAANAAIVGDDIESIRERAAMVFEEMAKMSKSGVQRVPAKKTNALPAPLPVKEAADEEVDMAAQLEEEVRQQPVYGYHREHAEFNGPPVEKIDRNYSPMAAFGLKKTTTASTQNVVMPSNLRVTAPQKLVYFEKEGLGTVPAFYHDVIVQVARDDPDNYEYTGFVVLIYDLRFEQNAARWFPPANDPYQRPWAALIKDDRRLYLVHTTGFQYVYDNREYCVLRVERAVMAPAAEPTDDEV